MTKGKQILRELAAMQQQLTGQEQTVTTDLQQVWQALASAQAVLVYLPWYERVDDQLYESNQIVLQHRTQQRVYFANPLKRGNEASGQELGGPTEGPARQVHADGLQSMSEVEFEKRFVMGGGCALI
ncbi:MAG: hypothetical protein IGS03_05510 [Candidatus Sericytochromatia bacterium]|nr:hypothetical protein [Candidatus Sericytochromatia bacterium]